MKTLDIGGLQKALDDLAAAISRLQKDISEPRVYVDPSCTTALGLCVYSKAMGQEYPRSCIRCGKKEKAPVPSETEPVCALCKKPYPKCFCLPL